MEDAPKVGCRAHAEARHRKAHARAARPLLGGLVVIVVVPECRRVPALDIDRVTRAAAALHVVRPSDTP
jgi:hypothetical protein